MYALRKLGVPAGRQIVCRLLGDFAERTRLESAVVFDGHPPRGALARQVGDSRVAVHYGHGAEADAVLVELIDAHTAPRRLTVVSTDRAIRKAARRRRCQSVRAEDFAETLLNPPPPRPVVREPRAKRAGLNAGQIEQWIEYFGLDGGADNKDANRP